MGFFLFIAQTNNASAAVVHINPETSSILTSGGIGGNGLGTLLLAGSFNVSVDNNTILFQNIDVHIAAIFYPSTGETVTAPSDYTVPFDIIPAFAMFDPVTNTFSNATLGTATNSWYGTYDGTHLTLNQYYNSNYIDDIIYDQTINATVVPIPATVWLMGTGLMMLAGTIKRKKVSGF